VYISTNSGKYVTIYANLAKPTELLSHKLNFFN
jgi:hypothetical protein